MREAFWYLQRKSYYLLPIEMSIFPAVEVWYYLLCIYVVAE